MRFTKRIYTLSLLILALIAGGCKNDHYTLPTTFSPYSPNVLLNIQPMSQFPLYPTGCEATATVMALNYAGISISVDEFIDEHLSCSSNFYKKDDILYGPDPYITFAGNPRSQQSYGCMSPVIERAILSCLKSYDKQIINCSGTPLEDLCHIYLDNQLPVILWATIDMQKASIGNSWFLENGSFFVWTAGEHCLLLVGYDEQQYYFNDPYYGTVIGYDREKTERAYAALGMQALVIQ